MTSTQTFKVLNWRDAEARENHGVEIRDLFAPASTEASRAPDYMSFFILAPGAVSAAHTHRTARRCATWCRAASRCDRETPWCR